jgi:hypothetical protein
METLGEAQAVEKSPWMLGNMNQLRKKPLMMVETEGYMNS